MRWHTRRRRQAGFSMVEMLVVIAIIGILTAILIPTLQAAIKAGREAAVRLELVQLAAAMERFKSESGLAYPPDFSSQLMVGTEARTKVLLSAMIKKLSRNNAEDVVAFLTDDPDGAGPRQPIDSDQDLTNGVQSTLTPDEALVFWLSLTAKSAEFPLGRCRLPADIDVNNNVFADPDVHRIFFKFDEARLVDPDNDGFPSYIPKYGNPVPYVYFDSRTYDDNDGTTYFAHYDPKDTDPENDPAGGFDYDGKGIARPYLKAANTFAEPKKFQIVGAGYDGDYGADLVDKVYPTPANSTGANLAIGDRDNFANFLEGRLDKDMSN